MTSTATVLNNIAAAELNTNDKPFAGHVYETPSAQTLPEPADYIGQDEEGFACYKLGFAL